MPGKANVSHDITVETVGDTTTRRGFMLAANQRGVRGHRVKDARTLQPRVLSMGEVTEAELPPDIELVWAQEDWRGGIGGINHRFPAREHRAPDGIRLALGNKIDTSIRNLMRPSREVKVTTVDTSPNEFKASGFAQVGTEVWAFVGRDVYSWDYSVLDWNIGTEPVASAVIYRNGVEFDGRTYAACWTAATDVPSNYINKADADANWVRETTGTNDFKFFAKGRNAAGDEVLWAGHQGANTHHVFSNTTPDDPTAWSTATEIGESDSDITALVEDGDTLIVCKTNGLWALYRDGTTENLTPEFERMQHPKNFLGAMNWNGHVLLPLGAGGLAELRGGRIFNISMEITAPKQTSLHGRVVAIAGTPSRLFILVQNGLDYELLMAEFDNFGFGHDFFWHHMGTVSATTGSTPDHCTLFAEGIPGPSDEIHHRIWVGVESTGSNLLPAFLPLDDDAEDGFTNDTDVIATTVEYDGNFPRVNKAFQTADFEINNLGVGGRTIVVEYRLDKGSWTNLGTLNGTGSTQTLTFTDATTGKILELRFTFNQTSVTTTAPELSKFRIISQLRPERVSQLLLRLYLADNMELLNGAIEGRAKGYLSQLRTWAGQAAEVIVVDSEGTSRDMVFLPGTLEVREIAHELGRRSEWIIVARLAEV